MCSIYGIVSPSGGETPSADLAERMGGATRHRGPDDAGVYRAPGVLLGSRRLAIIDVGGGHQPIGNEDGTVWAVCNGEIYNFRELREHLSQRGHVFRSLSDSEVVVHAYEEHGDAFVDHLSGMFALALWDTRRQRLLLVRDRLGIKPLYYMRRSGQLIFASEAKAILQVPGVTVDIDTDALRQYLALGYTPAPHCLFAGMAKLPPGCMLQVSGDEIRQRRYWSLPRRADTVRSESEWIEAVRAQIESSVVRQMVSDVPIGAFLSGGLDSSCIVAFMARNGGAPVRTYTVGFEGEGADRYYDERRHARRVAEHFGTEHRELVVGPESAAQLPRLVWHLDEPLADSALVTTYPIAVLAGREVKVALSGVGGDELFGGYLRYLGGYVDRLYRRIPPTVRERVLLPLSRRLPADRGSRWRNLSRMARAFIAAGELPFDARYRASVGVFSDAEIDTLCLVDGDSSERDALELALARSDGDDLDRMLRADLETQLPDDLLLLTDKMTMAASVECRVPLLDDALVDLVTVMPSDLKVRGRARKHVLTRALEGILPAATLRRDKRGFGAPVGAWLRRELAPLAAHLLSPQVVRQRGLLRPESVAATVAAHTRQQEDRTDHLIALMTLELWCRLYIDGRDADDVAAELPT